MSESNIYPIYDKLATRKDKEVFLGCKGAAFWLLGLSGSGKSTLAIELEKRLLAKGIFSIILDGDNLRSGINQDLGFSEDDRRENIRRTSEIAKLLVKSGVVVIISCITPLEEFRNTAKQIIGEDDYHEIFVEADYQTCKERDVKGLYKKASQDELEFFTGQASAFEVPRSPKLILKTEAENPTQSSDKLFSFVQGIISQT